MKISLSGGYGASGRISQRHGQFRKTIRLLPGVRRKGGFSTSVGRPGATINIGKRGVRGTVSLPGSGLSYSDMIVKRGPGQERVTPQAIGSDASDSSSSGRRNLLIVAVVVVAVIAALLFAAGLMSARQSTPLPSQRPITAPSAALPISAPAPLREEAGSAHVTTDANCRANPNSRAKVVVTLSGDEELTIVARQSGWVRITTASEDCWVASRFVE